MASDWGVSGLKGQRHRSLDIRVASSSRVLRVESYGHRPRRPRGVFQLLSEHRRTTSNVYSNPKGTSPAAHCQHPKTLQALKALLSYTPELNPGRPEETVVKTPGCQASTAALQPSPKFTSLCKDQGLISGLGVRLGCKPGTKTIARKYGLALGNSIGCFGAFWR